MDSGSIASGVLTILLPYVAKGAKEFIEVAGEVGLEKAKGLLDKLKAKLTGDKEASIALDQFEAKPERYKAILEDILKEKLTQDPSLARDLSETLQEMGPMLKVVQELEEAKGVTGIEASEMKKGDASVSQKMKKAENVTGIKIDRIG